MHGNNRANQREPRTMNEGPFALTQIAHKASAGRSETILALPKNNRAKKITAH
jgi:hypothetical protein